MLRVPGALRGGVRDGRDADGAVGTRTPVPATSLYRTMDTRGRGGLAVPSQEDRRLDAARQSTTVETGSLISTENRRLGLGVIAVFLFQGLLLFGYRFFEERADNPNASFVQPFINETTGAIGGLILFPILIWVCHRYPLRTRIWWKAVVAHAVAMPVLSVIHTLLNWAFRTTLYPLFGVESRYGPLSVRFAQEFFNDVWSYLMMIVLVYGFFYLRDARLRDLDSARLQAELGEARLRDLQARLHPHFLFNTLNAISANVADDPAGAERMIEQLAGLLRRSLSASGAQETAVDDEVETLELYLAIMQERAGSRIRAVVEVEPASRDAAIPTLLLQPLVENAIEHGLGPRAGGGRVSVRIARAGEHLRVVVEDDGVGLSTDPTDALGAGFGLSATVERVAALYGEAGDLRLEAADPGTRVTVDIPWRRCGVAATRA
jgi:two-component system LytT family sensor kinase